MPPTQYIHIVIASGIVFGVYTRASQAHSHAMTILGATVVCCELLERLPESVLDDLIIEDSYEDETVEIVVSFDDLEKV